MITKNKSYIVKLLSKLLCSIVFLLPLTNFSQEIYYKSAMGIGSSTFEGYSLFLDLGVEKRKNLFTIRADFNSELGHKYNDGSRYISERYNSNFSDFAFLYGRTYRKNDNYFTSLSMGLGYYFYKNKTLVDYNPPGCYPHFCTEHYVLINPYQGFGIALQHEQLFIFSDEFGMGLTVFGNLNLKRSFGGVVLSFVFGELR